MAGRRTFRILTSSQQSGILYYVYNSCGEKPWILSVLITWHSNIMQHVSQHIHIL